MIANERMISYIRSLGIRNSGFLDALYDEAVGNHVPVIRRETQGFLKTLLKICMPQTILEIGTAVGFSSLFMASYTEPSCTIRTIEIDPESVRIARSHIRDAGMEDRITVIEGDAAEVLKELDETADLIFVDAAKAQYVSYLPEVIRLMKEGSVLVSDNIFQDGNIIESRFMIGRRDRTIHKRMREYLYTITHDERFYTSLIPVGDGLAVSVMRQ